MKVNKTLVGAAVAAAITAGVSGQAFAKVQSADLEKCYGIVKSGKNDCAATGSNACAGQDMKDGDPNAWLFVLKGTCQKIVNGSLTPATPSSTK